MVIPMEKESKNEEATAHGRGLYQKLSGQRPCQTLSSRSQIRTLPANQVLELCRNKELDCSRHIRSSASGKRMQNIVETTGFYVILFENQAVSCPFSSTIPKDREDCVSGMQGLIA